jgi:hypothetical protein
MVKCILEEVTLGLDKDMPKSSRKMLAELKNIENFH